MNRPRPHILAGAALLLLALSTAPASAQVASSGVRSLDRPGGALNPHTYEVGADAKPATAKEASRERKLLESLEKPEDPETLRRFDKNSDGLLEDDERLTMFEALGAEPYKGPGLSKEEILKKYDKNGDGKLDDTEKSEVRKHGKTEESAWKSLLEKFDKDGDKRLSGEEGANAREALGKEEAKPEDETEARFFKNPREFREEIARNKIIDYVYAGVEADGEFGHQGGGEGLFWDASLSGGGEFNYKNLILARLVVGFDGHSVEFKLDEALARLGGSKKIPWFAEAGHSGLAFGEYSSHFKTDPATQVLGEVEGWYATAGYDSDAGGGSLTIFRGHDGSGDYDLIAAGSIQIVKDIDVGASWTSDISESLELRSLQKDLALGAGEEDARDFARSSSVMGASVFFSIEKDFFDLNVEFVTACGYFRTGVLDTHPVRPWAFDVEVAIRPVQAWEIAARFEMSRGIPDANHYTVGIGTSYGFCQYASASIEFLYGIIPGETDRPRVVVGLNLRF